MKRSARRFLHLSGLSPEIQPYFSHFLCLLHLFICLFPCMKRLRLSFTSELGLLGVVLSLSELRDFELELRLPLIWRLRETEPNDPALIPARMSASSTQILLQEQRNSNLTCFFSSQSGKKRVKTINTVQQESL